MIESLLQPDRGQPATSLQLVDGNGFETWLASRPECDRQLLAAQGFKGEGNQLAILPSGQGWSAAIGVTSVRSLGPWCLAKAAEALPEGNYRVEGQGPGAAMLGWVLAQYRFDRYRRDPVAKGERVLLTDEPARIEEALIAAEATFLVRDLVNAPAGDLGPAELEAAVRNVAEMDAGTVSVTIGAPLESGYPLVHAVGRAASPARAPRFIELQWGDQRHPKIVLVGKGVCFDSGGLDIKPSAGMRLMKKDMGGAAHALALAFMVMRSRLPIRLHLLIPAVENAISGDAFRPGDVLASRKGISVEIGNTDAEGRLILADALARAMEIEPELVLDFATLTGAARVALGPDLPALFCNDNALAEALLEAGDATSDPMWRMPLWRGYEEMLASDIADIGNAAEGGMAGAVTAALFLQKFVADGLPWAHLDTFAWRQTAKPGRPKGGEALGLRSFWAVLRSRYGN